MVPVEPIDTGPRITHNGAMTIVLARGPDPSDPLRLVIALTVDHAIPAGDTVTADFDLADGAGIIDGIRECMAAGAAVLRDRG
jgi:hypothetical protein